jgi:hypothetical protein
VPEARLTDMAVLVMFLCIGAAFVLRSRVGHPAAKRSQMPPNVWGFQLVASPPDSVDLDTKGQIGTPTARGSLANGAP